LHRGLIQVACVLLAACSTSGPDSGSTGTPAVDAGRWAVDAGRSAVAEELVDVVLFRTANGQARPVNVFIDHAYVASLMPGGYARVRACSGAVTLSAAFDDARREHQTRLERGQRVVQVGGRTRYWQVDVHSDTAGSAHLTASDETTFRQVATKRQQQTLARLAGSCSQQRAAGRLALDALASPD